MTCKHTSDSGEKCPEKTFAKGYCTLHYWRHRKGKPMDAPRYESMLTEDQISYAINSGKSARATAMELGCSTAYVTQLRNGRKLTPKRNGSL